MNDRLLRASVWCRARMTGLIKDESGEGVISVAIAVLIMAFLGALMWVAFNALWQDAADKTSVQVDSIGG